jgi:hypothetical protein
MPVAPLVAVALRSRLRKGLLLNEFLNKNNYSKKKPFQTLGRLFLFNHYKTDLNEFA